MGLPPSRRLRLFGIACALMGTWMTAPPPAVSSDKPAATDANAQDGADRGADPGTNPVPESMADAACTVFAGRRQCTTVSIDDPENCVLKIIPRPLPEMAASDAGCLIDDIGTAKVFLGKVAKQTPLISNSQVRITGRGAVQLLTKFGAHGAPVWESRNSHAFALKGDADRTRAALMTLTRLSSNLCVGPAGKTAKAKASAWAKKYVLGAKEAYRKAASGDLILIDVRHETEWRSTGIGAHAIPITMHQKIKSFVKQLRATVGPVNSKPVALICAEGVRSGYLQHALKLYGFSGIINVREGMNGGRSGPGWIKAGLPVRPYAPE